MLRDRMFLLAMIIVCFVYTHAEADTAAYYFSGRELVRVERQGGKKVRTTYCRDKIDGQKLGLSLSEPGNEEDSSVDVSPDGKYFVFSGRSAKDGSFRYFIAAIPECRVIRELTLSKADNAFEPARRQNAVFTVDSRKLFISWNVWNNKNIHDPSAKSFWLTKEYSGNGFVAERLLKNVIIPKRTAPVSSDETNIAAIYKTHCSACHPDAGKIKTVANIVEMMRTPPPAMPTFSRDKINDNAARAVADYIKLQIYYRMNM